MLRPDDITHLVVHCSDTADYLDIGARDIHAMHLGFGWDGIGYHRVIRRDGSLEMGRPEFWIGAHVFGQNGNSLGVCLIGRHFFADAQFEALRKVLVEWHQRYPAARICGHRDFADTDKSCPNFDVAAWCESWGFDAPLSPPQLPPV